MTDEVTTSPAPEAVPAAPETSVGSEDLDSLYAGVEFGDKPAADGEKPADGGEEKAPEQPPEEIKYEWEPPEEFKAQWAGKGEEGEKEYQAFQAYAKENGIKPEAFKGLMTKYASEITKVQTQVQQGLVKEWDETKKNWHQTILKDEEVGGQKYTDSKKHAALALKEFGTEGLAKELELTGFGHNPEIFKLLVRTGKAIGEGEFVRGTGAPAKQKRSIEEIFYDN